MSGPLAGRICLVAGASRGVGRGIARGLGEAGATVIVTARSSESGRRTDTRDETIEDTARLVDAAGGLGHHYVCDHTKGREVDQFVAWTLRRFGRIDALVGCIWSGNEGYHDGRYRDGSAWGAPFWRRPAGRLGDLLESALYAQLLTARAVAPAMVAAKRGVIILVAADDAGQYLGDIFYDLAQTAIGRLALGMSETRAPHGVTALTLASGPVRTERALEADRADPGAKSPLSVGRAAAALIADPDITRHSGQILHAADLAARYGFTGDDGTRPPRYKTEAAQEKS